MSWPVSDDFNAALRRSHTPTFRVELLENGEVTASSEPVAGHLLHVIGGSIDEDRKAEVGRRSADWSIVDPKKLLVPFGPSDIVYPLRDIEVRLWRGIEGVSAKVDPTAEGPDDVPLCTVGLERSRVTDPEPGRMWDLSGSDRSVLLDLLGFNVPVEIPVGTALRAATQTILTAVDPGHAYVIVDSPTTATTQALLFLPGSGTSPWMAIVKMWEAAGFEVFFDQLGQLVAQPIPNPLTANVAWQFLDDSQSIRVAPLSLEIDRRSLRNGVVVRASARWVLYGVFGEAWDTDPSSPTYFDPANPTASKVGRHPEEIEDALVGSPAEAAALAAAKLPDVLGVEEKIDFESIPHPGRTAGDVIELATELTGARSRLMLDRVTTPLLFKGTQSALGRRRVAA